MVAFVFRHSILMCVTQRPCSLRKVPSITEAWSQKAERMSLQERGQDTDREFIKVACKVGTLRRLNLCLSREYWCEEWNTTCDNQDTCELDL